jgi:hypothetical protein
VRGSIREAGESWICGGSPSPGLHLRCNPTSPRKRGEVNRAGRDYFAFFAFAFAAFFTGFSLAGFFSAFCTTGVVAAIRIARA